MDVLLFNPHAGRLSKEEVTADQLLEGLGDRGIDAYAKSELSREEIAAVTEASGRVIVAGGDGTIHALLKSSGGCGRLRLGIIPGGTANHFASSLGIPADVDTAMNTIALGHTKRIDLGKVNGTVFSQAAGAGFHAKAFHLYGERKEKSKLDAATTALKLLADWEPQLMRVVIDGEPYVEELTQVTAANTPDYGGIFTIAPDAQVDDGLLDVVILGKLTKPELIDYGYAAIHGAVGSFPKTYTTRAKRIEIASVLPDPIEVHADAQPVGYTPATIEVMPGCVEVIVPEERA